MGSSTGGRRDDIDPGHLTALQEGRASAGTLAEALAIDHGVLLANVLPEAGKKLRSAVADAQSLGILKRMQRIGAAIRDSYPALEQLADLATHRSDTVRGWACFAVASDSEIGPETLLERIQPFADDPHFTVREWAWMAARPTLLTDLSASIALLVPWTASTSERIRRFASEVLRPRGVWATHIKELKSDPQQGCPILHPLRADPSRYVQDSVANWINDAAKTRPEWARDLCSSWLADDPAPETERIVKRALRSLPTTG